MGKLDTSERKQLPASDFAIPSERKYPIQDESHARAALSMVARFGSAADKAKVRAAVHRRYPDIAIGS